MYRATQETHPSWAGSLGDTVSGPELQAHMAELALSYWIQYLLIPHMQPNIPTFSLIGCSRSPAFLKVTFQWERQTISK